MDTDHGWLLLDEGCPYGPFFLHGEGLDLRSKNPSGMPAIIDAQDKLSQRSDRPFSERGRKGIQAGKPLLAALRGGKIALEVESSFQERSSGEDRLGGLR
jgi:hypothetical protein